MTEDDTFNKLRRRDCVVVMTELKRLMLDTRRQLNLDTINVHHAVPAAYLVKQGWPWVELRDSYNEAMDQKVKALSDKMSADFPGWRKIQAMKADCS